MHNRTKVRRRVLACARCRKRKLSVRTQSPGLVLVVCISSVVIITDYWQCDGKVPACTRCVDAGMQCVGFDSSTQQEAPRSIADFLEAHIARLEAQRKSSSHQVPLPSSTIAASSPAYSNSHESESSSLRPRNDKCAFAQNLVNQVVQDITPSFLGVCEARPLLQCVVKETRLPSERGFVVSGDLDQNHPRSIINPQPNKGLFHDLMPDEVGANTLLQIYLDRVITQYPIYHRNDVTVAFNSIYHKKALSPGEDSARNRYIVCIIMAISLSTSARNKVRKANETAYQLVRHAMQWIPEVATNDIPGLQAILLLTQYIFLNPRMADLWLLTGLISQAVIDLGLHQEMPNDPRVTPYQRDMRRRLFWCAWEMEVGVCCIFLRPISLPIRRIDVAFPLEVDDTAITETGMEPTGRVSKFTQRIICRFRLIEADIISVLWLKEPWPKECASMEQWMQQCINSIMEWRREIYASATSNKDRSLVSRWNEMCLYSDIACPYILVSLNRTSRAIPNPSSSQTLTAMHNAVKVADGYIRQFEAEAGKIKYVFHPCHQVFTCALVFLQGLQRCKSEVADSWSWEELEDWMQIFTRCFSSIAERWTAAQRCLEEYEKLLSPIKEEYVKFLTQRANLPPPPPPPLSTAAPVTDQMYTYSTSTSRPAGIDEAYQFWSVFNPTSSAETEARIPNAYNDLPPRDWNTEFHLNYVTDPI